jgi:TonB family protein
MLSAQWLAGIDALGAALLHFLWQGAALGLLYVLLRPLCTGAAARYRLGMGTLLAMLLIPVATAIRIWPSASTDPAATVFAGDTFVAATTHALPHWHLQAALPWLVAIWLCGVLVLAMRSLWQWRRLQRLLRSAQRPGPEWEARLMHWRRRFGLRRPVRLMCSARAITPMLIGWIKPAILLPASLLSGFPPQQVELILAHELAHIRRWDYLANLFQVAVEIVLFYHPAVHWIGRDVRNAREECCDDLVLRTSSSESALAYARALAGLEELRLDLGTVAPALGADGGVLIARIRRIVGVTAVAPSTPRNHAVPLLLAFAALAAMLWQSQQRATQFRAAIESLSAQALALVSGNPRLTAPADFSVTLPAPDLAPSAPTLTIPADPAQPPTPAADTDLRIERPRIAVAAYAALKRIGDIATDRITTPDDHAPAQPSAPLQMVAPAYPLRAMEAGIEGNVEMTYRVDADGRVVGIRVIRARPSGVFEQAAKTALGAWRFPADAAGQERKQNFAFTLNRNGADDKCQSTTGTLICRHPGD